jgi:hypothetical protein
VYHRRGQGRLPAGVYFLQDWAWDWMVSWGILQGDFDAASQIDNRLAESIAAV